MKFLLFFLFHFNCCLIAQNSSKIIDVISIRNTYDAVLDSCTILLHQNKEFSNAVYLVEQVYNDTLLQEIEYYNSINELKSLAKLSYQINKLQRYKNTDSINYSLNFAINNVICGNTNYNKDNKKLLKFPFNYNFTDPQGDQDWTNTFVTKLLATHKGNCRSLTYLYKILADELGAKCWLALAPNHIYIRNFSKQIGWYNTELTSGTFPTDAWIAATGYVNTDAIRSGVYMDTLSNQQSIGLCIMDLAQDYIKQTDNYTDSFVLKCCNLVLQYHSVNPEALLTKAEALKRMYLKQKEENNPTVQTTYDEMEKTYIALVKLGYREMPYKTYQKWLKTAKHDKERYQNKKLNHVTQKN
jgi:hypothetical protein